MREKIKRPVTVWLTQMLLVILLLLDIFLIVNALFYAFTEERTAWGFRQVLVLIIELATLAMLITAFWGLATKRMYGRWLSLIMLIFWWAIMLLSQLYPSPGPIKPYEYDNRVERISGSVTQVAVHGFFLILIFRLATARKVSDFFCNERKQVE